MARPLSLYPNANILGNYVSTPESLLAMFILATSGNIAVF